MFDGHTEPDNHRYDISALDHISFSLDSVPGSFLSLSPVAVGGAHDIKAANNFNCSASLHPKLGSQASSILQFAFEREENAREKQPCV